MARSSFFRYELVLTALVGLVLIAPNVMGAEGKVGSGEFGVKFGHLGSGLVEYEPKSGGTDGGRIETDANLTGGLLLTISCCSAFMPRHRSTSTRLVSIEPMK